MAAKDSFVEALAKREKEDPEFKKNYAALVGPDPKLSIAKLEQVAEKAPPAYVGDSFVYRTAVVVLGVAVIAAIAGYIYLATSGVAVPEGFVALAAACAGGLIGLFVQSPNTPITT
jgi:hypothetical protein